MTTTPDRVRELVAELEASLPRVGGRIHFIDGADEFIVDGDQLGFQRLGIGLLRSTLEPTTSLRGIDEALDMSAYDLFDHPKQPPVVFRQVAAWPSEPSRGPFVATLRNVGCGIAVVAMLLSVLVLLVVGFGTIVGWFRA